MSLYMDASGISMRLRVVGLICWSFMSVSSGPDACAVLLNVTEAVSIESAKAR